MNQARHFILMLIVLLLGRTASANWIYSTGPCNNTTTSSPYDVQCYVIVDDGFAPTEVKAFAWLFDFEVPNAGIVNAVAGNNSSMAWASSYASVVGEIPTSCYASITASSDYGVVSVNDNQSGDCYYFFAWADTWDSLP